MSDIREARRSLQNRVLSGSGLSSSADRRRAFDNTELPAPLRALLDKVAKHASRVTDDDVGKARAAGYSEDQIFELVVCAAIGAASRQYESALALLDAASAGKESRAPHDSR